MPSMIPSKSDEQTVQTVQGQPNASSQKTDSKKKKNSSDKDIIIFNPDDSKDGDQGCAGDSTNFVPEEIESIDEGEDFFKTSGGDELKKQTRSEHKRTGKHQYLTLRKDTFGNSQFKIVPQGKYKPNLHGKIMYTTSKEPIEEALDYKARIERRQRARRIKSKLQRGRRIWRKRPADRAHLKGRAGRLSRHIYRHRVAGKRGDHYSDLGPSEKISIDKQLDKKVNLIKKLAVRLMTVVKRKDSEKMQGLREMREINEVSTKTLRSYMGKSHDDFAKNLEKRQEIRAKNGGDPASSADLDKPMRNRSKGLSLAHKKLSKRKVKIFKEAFEDFKKNDVVKLPNGEKRVVRGKTGDGSNLLRLHKIVGKTGLELDGFFKHDRVERTGETFNEETRMIDEAIWSFKGGKANFSKPGERSTVDWLQPRKSVASHLPFTGKNDPKAARKETPGLKRVKYESTETLDEMRLLNAYTNGKKEARVYRDNQWDDHIVKYYKNGKHLGNDSNSHHYDDVDDAHETAKHYVGLKEALEPWMGKNFDKPAYLRKKEYEANKRDANPPKALKTVKEDKELVELSKKAIGSYLGAAARELRNASRESGEEMQRHVSSGRASQTNPMGTKENPETISLHANVASARRRSSGIQRAGRKLSGDKSRVGLEKKKIANHAEIYGKDAPSWEDFAKTEYERKKRAVKEDKESGEQNLHQLKRYKRLGIEHPGLGRKVTNADLGKAMREVDKHTTTDIKALLVKEETIARHTAGTMGPVIKIVKGTDRVTKKPCRHVEMHSGGQKTRLMTSVHPDMNNQEIKTHLQKIHGSKLNGFKWNIEEDMNLQELSRDTIKRYTDKGDIQHTAAQNRVWKREEEAERRFKDKYARKSYLARNPDHQKDLGLLKRRERGEKSLTLRGARKSNIHETSSEKAHRYIDAANKDIGNRIGNKAADRVFNGDKNADAGHDKAIAKRSKGVKSAMRILDRSRMKAALAQKRIYDRNHK